MLRELSKPALVYVYLKTKTLPTLEDVYCYRENTFTSVYFLSAVADLHAGTVHYLFKFYVPAPAAAGQRGKLLLRCYALVISP